LLLPGRKLPHGETAVTVRGIAEAPAIPPFTGVTDSQAGVEVVSTVNGVPPEACDETETVWAGPGL